jgi:hypothetical protein
MAGRTQGEKIDELMRVTTSLAARVDNLEGAERDLKAAHGRFREELAGLTVRLALLEHQMNDLRKGKEEWGRRLWAIVGPILGALVGGVIGYFLHR